jgi:DcuC family C4-dicarboxylate transporter
MLGLTLACGVTAWMVYMIARKGYPVILLLLSGIILMACAVIFGLGTVLGPKETTGSFVLDVFDVVRQAYATRLAGLGLSIMCIGGFSRYMEHINASQALFQVIGAPLTRIRSTYVLLGVSYIVAQSMCLVAPDHSGHNLLLMVTLYPILIRLGATRLSALAIIASSHLLDFGPGSGNTILAAHILGMSPSVYFMKYQFPVVVPVGLAMVVTNFFVQRWWDRREGPDVEGEAIRDKASETAAFDVPKIYAVLPLLPVVLLLCFSPLVVERWFGFKLRMDPATAMIASTLVAMLFEYVRLRQALPVLASFKLFYEGAGRQFVVVVSLIVAGEIYSKGLISVGALDTLIAGAQSIGFSSRALAVVSSCITTTSAFFMGSGNAAFFSFGPLLPDIAHKLGVDTVSLLLPIQMTAGLGRTASPIAGALVAIAGIAGVSSFQVAKRTAIPMAVAFVVVLILTV